MIASVQNGAYHILENAQVERADAFKPTKMICGRVLTPLNYFETAENADRYTGGRLAQHICKHCAGKEGQ